MTQSTDNIARLGLGCGRMSNADSNRQDSIATIHAALDAGITHINTADFYTSGHNEMLIGEALQGSRREQAFISDKFGAMVAPNGSMYGLDVRPNHIKNYVSYSLKRLNVDYIDLYQPARMDLDIPVEEIIGVLADLVQAGYIRHIGLTQVDVETIRKANAIHPIHLIEYQYSLFNRKIEQTILPVADELGIQVVAFGTLSHGLLSGTLTKEKVLRSDSHVPLFKADNIDRNLELVEALRIIADEKGVSLPELAVAWVLAKGDRILPLIGARRVSQLQDSIKSVQMKLTAEDIERIEQAIPTDQIAGGSFPDMKFRNGEVVRG